MLDQLFCFHDQSHVPQLWLMIFFYRTCETELIQTKAFVIFEFHWKVFDWQIGIGDKTSDLIAKQMIGNCFCPNYYFFLLFKLANDNCQLISIETSPIFLRTIYSLNVEKHSHQCRHLFNAACDLLKHKIELQHSVC